MNGYFLSGTNDEHILVIRTQDYEDILRVIQRLAASRSKEMKALAQKLELEWFRRDIERNESGRFSGEIGPENSKKNQNRTRHRANQAPPR